MSARTNRVIRALSATLGVLLLLLTQTIAGQPVHEVRGHAVYQLVPPASIINQITINAAADENGVVKGSVSVWPSIFLLGLVPPTPVVPDLAGWTWVIRLTSLDVTGNVAHVEGMVVFDNRIPDSTIGCHVDFTVTDNGGGAADPPDELKVVTCLGDVTDLPLLGGNFTVR